MILPPSHEAIRGALTYIDANDREVWIRIGMALKSEFGDAGFDLFETWSVTAENFDAKAAKAAWKSFKQGGGITIATLIAEAKQHGFDPKQHAPAAPVSELDKKRIKQEQIARDVATADEIVKKHEAGAEQAEKIWNAASVAGQSPYLKKKKVEGHGVRFAGEDVLIRLQDISAKLWNVQRISPSGVKRFLSGARVSGCFHLIVSASVQTPAQVLIAEGYATAASLHQATGHMVAVGFNAGNLKHTTHAIRQKYPDTTILVCADDDSETEGNTGKNPGVAAAAAAAKSVGGYWCKPVDLPKGGSDFNDLAVASGLDVVRTQIEAALQAAQPAKSIAESASPVNEGAGKDKPKQTPPARGRTTKQDTNAQSSKPFFTCNDRGVWHHGYSQQGDPLPAQWICSPLAVSAKSRDSNNGAWGYLLEFSDADGNPKRWAMPASLLAGDGNLYRQTLLDMGLQIGAGMHAKNHLTTYIQTTQTDARVRCVDKTGWNGTVYVLPDRTIGEGDESVIFQSPGGTVSQFKQRGTLDQWRDEVASLCAENSRMAFCVCAAFAAPLLNHSGVTSGGFHVWGDSSSGKSTAFKIAASVNGGRDYARNWRMTDNSLEVVAAQHSDALLLLDEIGQVDPKVVGDTVYMLANETGKGRATQTATARKTHTWRTLFLSDGEVSLANHMSEAGKGTRGGHDVRMAHINADAGKGLGIYDTLHNFASGAALSDHLVKMSQQYYGVAGIAFIEWLVARAEKLSDGLRSRVTKLSRELCPAEAHGQVSRVADRFALVGVAGELATDAGITGWKKGEAIAAARVCFSDWLSSRGGAGNTEHTSILRQVSSFFQINGDARFTWWHRSTDDHRPNTINRAGLKRLMTKDGASINSDTDHHKEFGDTIHPIDAEGCELEYFVLPEVFRNEICKGYSTKAVTSLLIERGLLMPEGAGDKARADRKERLPGIGHVRCFRFNSNIVTAE